MSFEDNVADLLSNPVLRAEFVKIAAQADTYRDDEDPDQRSAERRKKALLWTLAGLAGVGGLGYLAHSTGAMGKARDWIHSLGVEPNKATPIQETLRKVRSTISPDVTVGLGALSASSTMKPIQRHMPQWMRNMFGVESQVGLDDFIRDVRAQAGGVNQAAQAAAAANPKGSVDLPHSAPIRSLVSSVGDTGKGGVSLADELRAIADPRRESIFKRIMADPVAMNPHASLTDKPSAPLGWWRRFTTPRDVWDLGLLRESLQNTIRTAADPADVTRYGTARSRLGELRSRTGVAPDSLVSAIDEWRSAPGVKSPLRGAQGSLGRTVGRAAAPGLLFHGIPWLADLGIDFARGGQ